MIDVGYAEPLHNGNNGWQFWHSFVLDLALGKSRLPGGCNELDKLPADSPFICYLSCLRNNFGLTRLVKKVKKWFTEGRKKSFDFRFTDKETRKMCHKYMLLLDSISRESDPPETKLMIATLAYCGLQLRDAVSLFSRVEIKDCEVAKLKIACQNFFNANSLLLQVSPTVWTIGYAIPYHVQILYEKYGLGLGLNSMQGREAKHVKLSRYARHSTLSTRWRLVLPHDYIVSVWMFKEDPLNVFYVKSKEQHIPPEINSEGFCYCGFVKHDDEELCQFCSSNLYKAVKNSAETGVLAKEICSLASVTAY